TPPTVVLKAPRQSSGRGARRSGGAAAGLTGTGIVMGTPTYLAPELVHGARDAPPSSDIWSFGVIAHEMLTGALPFAVAPAFAPGQPVRTSWHSARGPVPTELASLVERCLERDPVARPTADEILRVLAAMPGQPAISVK